LRTLLHVAARTLVERRLILVAAGVAALLPLLAPLLPALGAERPGDARTAAATAIAIGLACVVALLHGTTCLARDLRERRLSFYLARPLSAFSLWAGKLLAGVLLTGAALLIVFLPTLLLTSMPSWDDLRLVTGASGPALLAALAGQAAAAFGAGVGVVVVAIALAHAVAVMLSARSAWLVLDAVAFIALAGAGVGMARVVAVTANEDLLWWYQVFPALVLAAALVAAGLTQTASGRTDLHRGHRVLSLTLWPLPACVLAVLAAYAIFLFRPTLRSLERIDDIVAAGRGAAVVVSGPSRWRAGCRATFALDTPAGRPVRLAGPEDHSGVLASADGSTLVWAAVNGASAPTRTLTWLDLRRPDAAPQRTTIEVAERSDAIAAVSDDGALVALRGYTLFSVHELAGGRLVRSARLREWGKPLIAFVSRDRLRIQSWISSAYPGPVTQEVSAFDLATGEMRETGHLTCSPDGAWIEAIGSDFRSVVLCEWHDNEVTVTLCDGWTLERRAELLRRTIPTTRHGLRLGSVRSVLLADDTPVVAVADHRGARLSVFTAEGVPEGNVELGPWRGVLLGAEASPGRLVVALSREAGSVGSAYRWDETVVVDLACGKTEQIGAGLIPWSIIYGWSGRPAPPPGSDASRLFGTAAGLMVWEPGTPGRLRPVVPDRSR